nr:MAG TPA: hypothetical protein [Caudoviricetes sp.]
MAKLSMCLSCVSLLMMKWNNLVFHFHIPAPGI